MKKFSAIFALFFVSVFLFASCTKSSNGYSTKDHTQGIIKSWSWTGFDSGYSQGDSVIHPFPDTTHVAWPKYFYRVISDSSIPVIKVNSFCVSMLDGFFNYLSTDSVTYQSVTFDSTYSGAATSTLTYYYSKDSMSLVYHETGSYNSDAGKYYTQNWVLHTVSH